ncbi:MAG: hypothetical protein AAF557_08425 [Pseudomonadota bacterium]
MARWIAALAFLLVPDLAIGASFDDPEWPCVQRKVPNLSIGQMWAGPLIEDQDLKAWREDTEAAALAPALAIRRTSEEEASKLIQALAARLGSEKERTLKLLFAGTFTLIERERSLIIKGIGRYARTQTALTKAIEKSQNLLTELRSIKDPDFDTQDKIEELEDKILWDTRIYKDREQSLTFVCETPVILERRAFGLAREIMGHL